MRNEELKDNKNIFSLLTPNSSLLTHEVFWLASYALGLSSSELMARKNFSADEIAKINALIKRRQAHEPLQYIMGVADFYGRDFEVGPGVLIPRHDTETLIEAAKKIFPKDAKFTFLDWGTGSGCIAITLLLEFPNSFAYMLDASPEAIKYSKKNLSRFNLSRRAKLITDINQIEENNSALDLIISNPPYIPSHEIENLMPEVKNHEPILALDGGSDGMNFYKLIFEQAEYILKNDNNKHTKNIILEAGDFEQVQKLKTLDESFTFVNQILDTGNFPRALIFRKIKQAI